MTIPRRGRRYHAKKMKRRGRRFYIKRAASRGALGRGRTGSRGAEASERPPYLKSRIPRRGRRYHAKKMKRRGRRFYIKSRKKRRGRRFYLKSRIPRRGRRFFIYPTRGAGRDSGLGFTHGRRESVGMFGFLWDFY